VTTVSNSGFKRRSGRRSGGFHWDSFRVTLRASFLRTGKSQAVHALEFCQTSAISVSDW